MRHFVTHTPDLIITFKDTYLEVLDFEMGAGLENSAYYSSKKLVLPCYTNTFSSSKVKTGQTNSQNFHSCFYCVCFR